MSKIFAARRLAINKQQMSTASPSCSWSNMFEMIFIQ